MCRIDSTRDAPHEGTQWTAWTVASFEVDAIPALALLKAIVAEDIHPGDSFRERIELLFALPLHDLSTRGVFL